MSEQTPGSEPAPLSLPDAPNLDWLRKQAKRRLTELRAQRPAARLADAQFDLARQYGFSSWRALKAHVDALTVDGQLFDAARNGDVGTLASLLDQHPDTLRVRNKPYEWTLLHAAAWKGHLDTVELLLRRGLNVDVREKGDNTTPMFWAAANGHLEVVRRLADAGGDVAADGDDHNLEVIGWATCFDDCHDTIAEFLVHRGARHHIFSAIAMNLGDVVRRMVAEDPEALRRPMSRNEDHRLPLHFAVLKNRPEMVALLLELGADPLAVDSSGHPAASYATSPDIDRRVMEAIRARGGRDLVTLLALGDQETAERAIQEGGESAGALHLMAKRGDVRGVRWLLDHGADPNSRWWHWDAEVTPLHLAASQGHADAVRLLLQAGADPTIRDNKHEGDAIGWATHFGRPEIVQILEDHTVRT